jgi:hypothetical protein
MIEPHDEAAGRDPYYTRSSATSGDIPRLVVKCDDAFVVSDDHGDFPELPESEFGLYVGGTRFLRRLDLALHGQRPLLLGAAVADDGRQLAADLTNPDLSHGEILVLKGRTLRLARRLALGPSELTEVLTAESFGSAPHELLLSWRYAADFADGCASGAASSFRQSWKPAWSVCRTVASTVSSGPRRFGSSRRPRR